MDRLEAALETTAKAWVKFKHEQNPMNVQDIQLNALCHFLQGTVMERVIWGQIQAESVLNKEEEAEADNTLQDVGFHSI